MNDFLKKPLVKVLMLKGEKGETGDVSKENLDKSINDLTKNIDNSINDLTKNFDNSINDLTDLVSNNSSRIDDAQKGINNTNSRIDDAQKGIKNTNGRIDNLIVSSGSDSSAEVIDARSGYDGTSYDTLGNAIREQVNYSNIRANSTAYVSNIGKISIVEISNGSLEVHFSDTIVVNYKDKRYSFDKNTIATDLTSDVVTKDDSGNGFTLTLPSSSSALCFDIQTKKLFITDTLYDSGHSSSYLVLLACAYNQLIGGLLQMPYLRNQTYINSNAYIANNGKVDLDFSTIANPTAHFSDVININYYGKQYSIDGDKAISDLTSNFVKKDDTGNGFTILVDSPDKSLVFNTITKKLEIRGRIYMSSRNDFLTLICLSSGQPVGGLLQKSFTYTYVENKVKFNNNSFAYLSNNKKIDHSKGENGSSILHFNESLNVCDGAKGKTNNFTADNFISMLGSDVVTKDDSGNGFTLALSAYNYLCYNGNNTLSIVARYDMPKVNNLIPLLITNYNDVCGGLLMHAIEKNERYDNIDTKIKSFSDLFINDLTQVETFLFFTDPHLYPHNTDYEYVQKSFNMLSHVYNNVPAKIAICGGDWLGNSDTKHQATYKLGQIDGAMRNIFKNNYYHIVGNHDTNYQGVDDSGMKNAGRLPRNSIVNLWLKDYGKNYYKFKGVNTKFYVFDTETDWDNTMSDYRWEQVEWFANGLINDDDSHNVILAHIFTNQEKENIASGANPMALPINICAVAKAYNDKTIITLNSKTYDFTKTAGKISFYLCGHSHYDYNLVYNGIPVVITTNAFDGSRTSFDLCMIDYDNNKLHTVRIGEGDNRDIDIL